MITVLTGLTDEADILADTPGVTVLCGAAARDNLLALINDLNKAKPATSKGIYLKKITVSSTMGPGVVVDQASLGL